MYQTFQIAISYWCYFKGPFISIEMHCEMICYALAHILKCCHVSHHCVIGMEKKKKKKMRRKYSLLNWLLNKYMSKYLN